MVATGCSVTTVGYPPIFLETPWPVKYIIDIYTAVICYQQLS